MAQVQVSALERGKIKTNVALYSRKARHCKIKSLVEHLETKYREIRRLQSKVPIR